MGEPERLSSEVKSLLKSGVEAWVSAATVWELNIKAAKGKLLMPANFEEALNECGFRELSINWAHAQYTQKLPPLHSDPFDRLIIAQAAVEGLVLISRDKKIHDYPIATLMG